MPRGEMETWLYLAASALLAGYVLLWARSRRARTLLANLPSYPELPLVGNILQLSGGGERIFHLIDEISKISEEKQQPFVVWIGQFPVLMCHDPDDVRTIANNLIEKPYYYNFGKIWLGDGLLTAPALLWKQNIKKLAGVFSSAVVAGYQNVFNAQAHTLVEGLKTKAGAKPFDVMHFLAYTTLDSICHTALGVARISDSVEKEKYYKAFHRSLELLLIRGLNLLTHLDFLYKLTPGYRELTKTIRVLHNVSDTVLQKKKLEREKTNKNSSNEPTKDAKFRSFLDNLLDISETDPLMTEQQIKSEVDTIILGGQETIASTVFFALLMIGSRPRVQSNLYEELKTIFGNSKRPVEKEDLNRMVYCEAVINETLRMFPPVPVVMRYADKELQLKCCKVPIGTGCAINVWGAGRSKHAWGPDACEYKPERWLANEPPSTAAAFLAFSYGRRSCIGKKYAMALLKTVLAYCVRELEFTSDADMLQFKVDLTLKAISRQMIQVKLRSFDTHETFSK